MAIEEKHGVVALYLDDVLEPDEASRILSRIAGDPDPETPTFDYVLKRWISRPEDARRLVGSEIQEFQAHWDPDTEFLWVRTEREHLTTADLVEIYEATFGACR